MSEAERDPGARGAVSAEALLRRIFDIVAEEAGRNPKLMTQLMAEIASAGRIEAKVIEVVEPQPATKRQPRGRRKIEPAASTSASSAAPEPQTEDADELNGFNPIAIASEQGAEGLRDHLRFVKRKEPLAKMARRYALDVPTAVTRKKASLSDMVDAIVTAAEQRIREQELSGG